MYVVGGGGRGFCHSPTKKKKKGGEREGVKYATTTSFCVQRKKMYSEPVTNIYSTSSIE